jgi:hypothetical protein
MWHVWEEKRNAYRTFSDEPKKRNLLKHLGIDGRK